MTLHMTVVFKSQYLFVAGAKPFPANRNVKHEYFLLCFPNIPYVLPVVYMLELS